MGFISAFSRLSGETSDRGLLTIFQDKFLTRTYYDEAGDYAVSVVLSRRDLVFKPDLSDKHWAIIVR